MARSVTLRPWQKTALERLSSSTSPDFLAVATPGAGKTTFALTAARTALAAGTAARIVVVVPTAHLKRQWAEAALHFDLHLDPGWQAADGRLPHDMHGIVTTYQQVATSWAALRPLTDRSFVVFDEVHHAADERAWGDAVRQAFEGASRRLSLSGTPFRSDTAPIPFVRYDDEEARPDFEYGYADALVDGGVVRPVYFPRLDGHMEWTAPDGSLKSHTFEDALDHASANQRLRTALSPEGEWLPHVLGQAHERLGAIRAKSAPDAGGLVIASDQEHARAIAELFRTRFGVRAVVATSDDPEASTRISDFSRSDSPWLIAVRMVSEGVDIPRLRVGVFATTTTTELFFRQAVGRLVRWVRGGGDRRQSAFLFIPDDPRLRARAFRIAEQRRHSLRKDSDRETVTVVAREQNYGPEEQLSLFAPLSATPIGDGEDEPTSLWDLEPAPYEPSVHEGYVVDLPPLPGALAVANDASTVVRRDQKKKLREANAEWASLISRRTNMSHAQVNAELNRLAGVRKITEATTEQLERRLRAAEKWLASLA